MQSLEARSQYRNSFHCAYRIFTEEGVLRFWTGTTPRLVRLVVSDFKGCMRCLTEPLVALGWYRLHRVRKGDRSYWRSILVANHHCIIPHRIFLSFKLPDLTSDLIHVITLATVLCAACPRLSKIYLLLESTTRVFDTIQYQLVLNGVVRSQDCPALGHTVAVDFPPVPTMGHRDPRVLVTGSATFSSSIE